VDSLIPPVAHSFSFSSLDIPGALDVAVRLYSEWQQSNVTDADWKIDVQKACDVTIEDGLDLEQIYTDDDPDFFIKKGVKKQEVTRRFVRDIPKICQPAKAVSRYRVRVEVV
jgi:hypothetical protein